jgi:hypothetical protein
MQAVGTEEGRLQVLKRYVLPLVAASSFEENDERLGGGYCDPVRKRLADDRRLAVEDAKHRLLLLQYRNYLDNMGWVINYYLLSINYYLLSINYYLLSIDYYLLSIILSIDSTYCAVLPLLCCHMLQRARSVPGRVVG